VDESEQTHFKFGMLRVRKKERIQRTSPTCPKAKRKSVVLMCSVDWADPGWKKIEEQRRKRMTQGETEIKKKRGTLRRVARKIAMQLQPTIEPREKGRGRGILHKDDRVVAREGLLEFVELMNGLQLTVLSLCEETVVIEDLLLPALLTPATTATATVTEGRPIWTHAIVLLHRLAPLDALLRALVVLP